MPGGPKCWNLGGFLALRAHCALLLDYVPPEEPQAHPLETPLELGDPNCPTNPHNVAKAVNGNRNFIYAPGVFRIK